MKITLKAYLFTVAALLLLMALVIYRYEKLLAKIHDDQTLGRVAGGTPAPKPLTAAQIITLIKNSKEYLGDSLTIYDDGQIYSHNGNFEGTITAVTSTDANMDIVRFNTANNRLPIQYNIYQLAAQYYRQQYHIPSTGKPN